MIKISPVNLFKTHVINKPIGTDVKPAYRGALSSCNVGAKGLFDSMICSHTGARYFSTNRSIMDAIREGTYPSWFFKSSDLEGERCFGCRHRRRANRS